MKKIKFEIRHGGRYVGVYKSLEDAHRVIKEKRFPVSDSMFENGNLKIVKITTEEVWVNETVANH